MVIKDLIEFHETVKYDVTKPAIEIVAFGRIIDYAYIGRLLDRVEFEHVIELQNYIDGKEYLSVIREFKRPYIPEPLAFFIEARREK